MALSAGELNDLMGGVQGAGSRGACSSTGRPFLDEARAMPAKPPNGSRRSRWRRRAMILLLACLRSDVAHHEGLPTTIASTQLGRHPISGAGKSIAQDATSDPGTELVRAEPKQRVAPQPPDLRDHAPQSPRSKPERVTPVIQRGRAPVRPEDSLDRDSFDLGSLDRTIIQRYVRRNDERINHCYETRRQLDQTLAGVLETNFVILPSGSVASVAASGLDSEVAACVADVLKTIRFPRSGGTTKVSYPFHFVARPASGPRIPIYFDD